MLQPGHDAPPFTLADQSGQPTALSDLLRDGPILLYFYPADFTPMCTKQACLFRDRSENLQAAGVRIVGISSASAKRHGAFSDKFRLRFTLLADPGRRVAKQYEATALLGVMPRRVSYFIGPDGKVIDASQANLSVAAHGQFIDRILAHRGRASADTAQ